MERKHNLDFLRFVMSFGIVWYHVLHSNIIPYVPEGAADRLADACKSASAIVECFLIMGGYFLWHTVKSLNDNKGFLRFAANRWIRLWPVLAFQTVVLLIIGKEKPGDALLDLFLMRASGLTDLYRGIVWYIGPYFWASLLIGGIFRVTDRKKALLLLSLLMYIGWGLVFKQSGGRETLEPFIPLAMLRACAGLSAGVLLGALIEAVPARRSNILSVILHTAAETASAGYLVLFFFFGKKLTRGNIETVLLFVILLYCMIVRKGLLSRLLNNKYCGSMGKYAYSVYVMQQLSFYLLIPIFWKAFPDFLVKHMRISIGLSSLFAVGVGVAVYYLVEKPATGLLKKHIGTLQPDAMRT